MKKLYSIFILSSILSANISDKEIANMFILGFYGTDANKSSVICKSLERGLGGVILFAKSPVEKGVAKNFYSKNSLINLTKQIKNCGNKPFIAIDQEGGLVQRVNFKTKYPKASTVAKNGVDFAKKIYTEMAKELHSLGFNLNFAPVVDLAINPQNRVIYKWGRSYGSNFKEVVKYASIFIDAMHSYKVAATLKHFPGHGSSMGDTHKGFVDVTNQWQRVELEPYRYLNAKADAVMVAHIFNKNLDSDYPASLSKRVVSNLLKKGLSFRGVVISDDLQMGAIAKHYSLKEVIKNSINAGVDVMLFANQISPRRAISLDKLIKTTRVLLKNGNISESSIKEANRRINNLKNRLYQ